MIFMMFQARGRRRRPLRPAQRPRRGGAAKARVIIYIYIERERETYIYI